MAEKRFAVHMTAETLAGLLGLPEKARPVSAELTGPGEVRLVFADCGYEWREGDAIKVQAPMVTRQSDYGPFMRVEVDWTFHRTQLS